jgi:hypothetical protein
MSAIIAYSPDPSTTIADTKPSKREKTTDGRYVYRIDRQKSFTNTKKAVDSQLPDNPESKLKIDDWIRIAEEIFSSPSKRERGENGSFPVLDDHVGKSSPASQVPATARSLPGGFRGVPSLLDYRNTQAENYKKYFNKVKPDIDLYQLRPYLHAYRNSVFLHQHLFINHIDLALCTMVYNARYLAAYLTN